MENISIQSKEGEEEDRIIKFVIRFFDFIPFSYQSDFLKLCDKYKRVAALWSRQSGKSTCVSLYALYKCLIKSNLSIIIVAPTQAQSSELYVKLRKLAEGKDKIRASLKSSTATELSFDNGSRVKALPCGPEGVTIRGFTADIVILEECGYIKDSIVNEVILPMIAATDGQVIKIGTPKGKNNFWQSCYGKETNYKLSYVPYTLALNQEQYKQEFIDEQKNNLTELEFRTEYEAQFIEDSDSYFKQALIESCIDDYELWDENYARFNILHKFCTYYCGVDIARLGEDVTVIKIIERRGEYKRLCYYEEIKHQKLTFVVGRLKQLNNVFQFKKICLDETGIGAGPTDMLEEEFPSIVQGVTFTIKSKEDMYSNLKKEMEQGKLKFPMIKKLFYEMSDLRYEVTSSGNTKIHHSEGGHDDYPDALALAVWACKEDSYELGGRHIF